MICLFFDETATAEIYPYWLALTLHDALPSGLPLSAKPSDLFGFEFELPVLAPDELYASKLVAALDLQHPRDLFDVWQLYESGDISDGMVECFVIYLAGHNRDRKSVG